MSDAEMASITANWPNVLPRPPLVRRAKRGSPEQESGSGTGVCGCAERLLEGLEGLAQPCGGGGGGGGIQRESRLVRMEADRGSQSFGRDFQRQH